LQALCWQGLYHNLLDKWHLSASALWDIRATAFQIALTLDHQGIRAAVFLSQQ